MRATANEKQRNIGVKAAVATLSTAKWLLVRDEVPKPLTRQAINEGVAASQLHSS
jgi:hypothetical protein